MKIYILTMLLYASFFNGGAFAQTEESLALQSLHFLNKQFVLHLRKMNEPVLISISNDNYVCNEFVDKQTLKPLARLRFHYELKKVGERKYDFTLKVISEYNGSFEVLENNGSYCITNLRYVKRSQ